MNYSLLRYPGGKTKAVKAILQFIPKQTKEICSPFFGGGSLEIAMSRLGISVYGYDNFSPLVNFWNAIQTDKDRLLSIVKTYMPLSKESFYNLQKEILISIDKTEIAAMFYVLNRCSFSGMGLSGGMSPNHPRFTPNQIDSVVNFKDVFEVKHLSFEKSIPIHNCLIYADPPYLINQSLYGTKGNMHTGFNHVLLSEILNKRGNFIISYNDSEEVKNMYSDHDFHFPKWKYGLGNNKDSREIVITSKDLGIKRI